MQTVTKYIAKDGEEFDNKDDCECYEYSQELSEILGFYISPQQFAKIKKFMYDKTLLIKVSNEPAFVPAAQLKPFFDKTPETLHKEVLAYGERWEKPSNPGIGSNR